jgi:ubiquinone/menaquinone biosynthesis C-methylase UbiE
MKKEVNNKKVADQYDNSDFNYLRYWDNRTYENDSEAIAIKKLLRGLKFESATDLGGGYGRISKLLAKYSKKVILAEPSQKQLDLAKDFLKKDKSIQILKTQADAIDIENNSQDLVTMIRVMHHLPKPAAEFKEISRILKKDGYFMLEIANKKHFLNRIRSAIKFKSISDEPEDIRSKQNRTDENPAFVNHNPKKVINDLEKLGFTKVKMLSVSNLRSPMLKKLAPKSAMLVAENLMQNIFSGIYFGPSIFVLLKKNK